MVQKKSSLQKSETDKTTKETIEDQAPPAVVLTSQQEVLDELKMSVGQFTRLMRKYPFVDTGVAGKINGRWHVAVEDVWRWHNYVHRQEARHPGARRMRPEEPPDISSIRGRDYQFNQ